MYIYICIHVRELSSVLAFPGRLVMWEWGRLGFNVHACGKPVLHTRSCAPSSATSFALGRGGAMPGGAMAPILIAGRGTHARFRRQANKRIH